MKKVRVLPTPSMAVAITALVVAAGGGAVGAALITGAGIKNGSVTGLDIKNESLTGVDVKNKSLGVADLTNAAVAALKGAAGAPGAPGAAGSDANGATMGTAAVTSNVTRFTTLGGTGGSGASASPVGGITPNKALTMGQMAARVDGLLGLETVAVTVQLGGVDTALTCTTTAANPLCEMPGSLAVPPRSLVGIKMVSSTTTALFLPVSWSWTFS